MTPRLAVVFPAHASGAPLLRRSVRALHAQTAHPDIFEVVVACDGGDPDGAIADALDGEHPFRLTVVDSPRPAGDVPHRNHARNAGWRAASAPLCWMLDADFILPPDAVDHALAEHDASAARGLPAVLTPCLAGFGGVGPADWLRLSEGLAAGVPLEVNRLLARWADVDPGIYSGFPERYEPSGPSSETLRDLPEGMPLIWRGLLEAIGGFDETFVGWGGDKEELVGRLNALQRERLIDVRLLRSVRAMHQPHPRDPLWRAPDVRPRQRRREAKAREIRTKRPWWLAQLRAAREALPGAVAAACAEIQLRP